VKDSNITLAPTKKYNIKNQCYGKTAYTIKRRAIARAREYAELSGDVYTVYECPHCHKFHIGKVRVE